MKQKSKGAERANAYFMRCLSAILHSLFAGQYHFERFLALPINESSGAKWLFLALSPIFRNRWSLWAFVYIKLFAWRFQFLTVAYTDDPVISWLLLQLTMNGRHRVLRINDNQVRNGDPSGFQLLNTGLFGALFAIWHQPKLRQEPRTAPWFWPIYAALQKAHHQRQQQSAILETAFFNNAQSSARPIAEDWVASARTPTTSQVWMAKFWHETRLPDLACVLFDFFLFGLRLPVEHLNKDTVVKTVGQQQRRVIHPSINALHRLRIRLHLLTFCANQQSTLEAYHTSTTCFCASRPPFQSTLKPMFLLPKALTKAWPKTASTVLSVPITFGKEPEVQSIISLLNLGQKYSLHKNAKKKRE